VKIFTIFNLSLALFGVLGMEKVPKYDVCFV